MVRISLTRFYHAMVSLATFLDGATHSPPNSLDTRSRVLLGLGVKISLTRLPCRFYRAMVSLATFSSAQPTHRLAAIIRRSQRRRALSNTLLCWFSLCHYKLGLLFNVTAQQSGAEFNQPTPRRTQPFIQRFYSFIMHFGVDSPTLYTATKT